MRVYLKLADQPRKQYAESQRHVCQATVQAISATGDRGHYGSTACVRLTFLP